MPITTVPLSGTGALPGEIDRAYGGVFNEDAGRFQVRSRVMVRVLFQSAGLCIAEDKTG